MRVTWKKHRVNDSVFSYTANLPSGALATVVPVNVNPTTKWLAQFFWRGGWFSHGVHSSLVAAKRAAIHGPKHNPSRSRSRPATASRARALTRTRKVKRARTPAQKAATARMLAANKARRLKAYGKYFRMKNIAAPGRVPRFVPYKNPRAKVRKLRKAGAYFVQYKRGAAWFTLKQCPTKTAAAALGQRYADKYPSKRFRVFWK